MTKTPALRGLLAGFLLVTGSVTQATAQPKQAPTRVPPTPAQMLDARLGPKFDDVVLSTPTPEEIKDCTVTSVQGQTTGSAGWLLLDGKKQPLRRYFDSNGDDKVDMWSYFKDGVEVYREIDTAFKGLPNNFRWLNAGGMKWGIGGVDKGKGYVSSWRMISAEEVGYEAFQAVATQDFARLKTLFISEAEMQMIKLPATKIKAIQAEQMQAQKQFAALLKTVNLQGAKFDGVESAVPQCDTSTDVEIIKFASRPVRYETIGAKKERNHGWIHTLELIQVGMAWRLVDVPSDKDPTGIPNNAAPNPAVPQQDQEVVKLLQELSALDLKTPAAKQILAKCPEIEAYFRKRIPLVQKIVTIDKADQREGWYKQLFDNLMAMSQNSGDKDTMALLTKMKDDVVSKMPGSNLAAYGVYRDMWNRYSIEMALLSNAPAAKIADIQDKWLDSLTDFVKKYSKADDTPEALHQLAIGCEFGGKTEEAKRWYKQLYDNFANHHFAARAKGSESRLNLVGRELKLTAPILGANKAFDISQLKGKLVIVHYWGSYSDQYKTDFAQLKTLIEEFAKQNVELVSINLDETAAKATEAVTKAQAPGIHLFQATNDAAGLNSPLATQYGIHILPTVFMVGRDGRVTNNSLQIGDVRTELKKLQNDK